MKQKQANTDITNPTTPLNLDVRNGAHECFGGETLDVSVEATHTDPVRIDITKGLEILANGEDEAIAIEWIEGLYELGGDLRYLNKSVNRTRRISKDRKQTEAEEEEGGRKKYLKRVLPLED